MTFDIHSTIQKQKLDWCTEAFNHNVVILVKAAVWSFEKKVDLVRKF